MKIQDSRSKIQTGRQVVAWLAVGLAVFSGLTHVWAEPATDGGFTKGNALYAAGQFAEAAAAYEGAARQGEVSANLYYNLGNAHYRLGDRGRAVLNYQRALLLEPGHTEAATNLAFIRGRGVEGSRASPGVTGAVRDALAGPGVDFYGWLAAGAGWLGVFGLVAAVFYPRWRGRGVVVAGAGVVACLLCAGLAVWVDDGLKSPRRAVVLTDSAPALYSPADNAKAILRLPVGGEVKVLSEQGAWTYVQLADGARGWMASENVARVVPVGG